MKQTVFVRQWISGLLCRTTNAKVCACMLATTPQLCYSRNCAVLRAVWCIPQSHAQSHTQVSSAYRLTMVNLGFRFIFARLGLMCFPLWSVYFPPFFVLRVFMVVLSSVLFYLLFFHLPDILQHSGIGAQPRWCCSHVGSEEGGGIRETNFKKSYGWY